MKLNPNSSSRIERAAYIALQDSFVKAVFDHLRNLGILALLVGAMVHILPAADTPSAVELSLRYTYASILAVLVISLFLLNTTFAFVKLQEAGTTKSFALVYTGIIDFLSVLIVYSLVANR